MPPRGWEGIPMVDFAEQAAFRKEVWAMI